MCTHVCLGALEEDVVLLDGGGAPPGVREADVQELQVVLILDSSVVEVAAFAVEIEVGGQSGRSSSSAC